MKRERKVYEEVGPFLVLFICAVIGGYTAAAGPWWLAVLCIGFAVTLMCGGAVYVTDIRNGQR